MKFYVESGNLKTIITSSSPMDACVGALRREVDKYKDNIGMIEFEDTFFVSEKGFLSDREPFSFELPLEKIYDTEDILQYLDNMPP